jgi:hypothetical protein
MITLYLALILVKSECQSMNGLHYLLPMNSAMHYVYFSEFALAIATDRLHFLPEAHGSRVYDVQSSRELTVERKMLVGNYFADEVVSERVC